MCMFHEPEGFWPTIFLHIFLGALKSHYPVSSRAPSGPTSSEKVLPPLENTLIAKIRRFPANHCQSLKKCIFLRRRLAKIRSGDINPEVI